MLLECWVFYMSLRSFVRTKIVRQQICRPWYEQTVFVLFFFVFCILCCQDCPFLNAPSVFSNVYLLWGLQNILSVRCVKNKAGHFARQLQKTMKGLGTDDDTLVRIVVTRCEIDMVQIKEEFQTLTGQSLEQFIAVSIFPKVACLYLDGWRALEK